MIGDPTSPDFDTLLETVIAIQFTNGPGGIVFSGLVIKYEEGAVDLFGALFQLFY
jgi:hypothetical protein